MIPVSLLFSVSLILGGLHWWNSPVIFLTVDGNTRKIHPKAKTVRELLAQERVSLGPEDFCAPELGRYLFRNTAVKVTRVSHRSETISKKTDPHVVWSHRTRTNLRRALVQKGSWTEEVEIMDHVLYDRVEVSRHRVKKTKKVHSFFTLTLFHKKSGLPVKTYDLLRAKTFKMLATAYYVGDPMVPGDETFLGHKLQRGLVAIDPKVIPLRTRLYIPGYGYAYASDTGSAIKGRRIDLAVKDAKEEARYNHRKVTIYLLEKARTW